MLIKTGEFYSRLTKEYSEDFENEFYEFSIRYKNTQKKPTNPDPENIRLLFFPKKMSFPDIDAIPKKADDTKKNHSLKISKLFQRSVYFEDMHGETGDWAIAAETLVDANKIIEETFPGYNLTSKTDW